MNQAQIGQDLASLARTLARLVIAQNSQSVRQVEITLSMVQRFPNYFEMLLQLLKIKEFMPNIRKLATAMINNYVQDHLTDNDDLGKYSNQLLSSLKDADIDFSLKANIAVTLAKLIKKDEKKQNFYSLVSTLKGCLNASAERLHLDLCIFLGRAIIESCVLSVAELAPLLDRFIDLALTAKECLRVEMQTYNLTQIMKISERIRELLELIISFFITNNCDVLADHYRLTTLIRIVPLSQHGRVLFSKDVSENTKIHQSLNYLKSGGYNLISTILKMCSNASNGLIGDFNRKISSIVEQIMSGLSGMFIYESQYSSGMATEQILASQLNFLSHLYAAPALSILLNEHDYTILKVISRILEYSRIEIQNFIKQPVLFTNLIVGVIQAKLKQSQNQDCEPFTDSESLKVQAAQLLVQISKARPILCHNILEELVLTITNFTRSGKECINALLMVNVLCKFANCSQVAFIGLTLESCLRIAPPSVFMNNEKTCIQYALYLVTLCTFIREVKHHEVAALQSILMLSAQLISKQTYFEVYQILACELIENLSQLSEQHPWIINQALKILDQKLILTMQTRTVTVYLLDAIFHIFNNTTITSENCQFAAQLMRTAGKCIQTETSYQRLQQIIVNKCWNIIRQIVENSIVLTNLMPCIQQTLTPLIDFFVANLKGDFEQDCFLLMATIIKHTKKVSLFSIQLYRLIPLVFYKQYNGCFGLAFEALQLLIYYGKDVLLTRPNILQEIIQMFLFSIKLQNDADACEGVLLLHSLVLSIGKNISESTYPAIFSQIDKKYKRKSLWKPLITALACLQGLCIGFSNSEWASPQNLNMTLTRMLDESNHVKDFYFSRIIFISTCEIILKLTPNLMKYYVDDCIVLLKQLQHTERREPQSLSQISVLKKSMINYVTKLDVKAYLSSFIIKLKQKHEEVFDYIFEQTQWQWKIQEFESTQDKMMI